MTESLRSAYRRRYGQADSAAIEFNEKTGAGPQNRRKTFSARRKHAAADQQKTETPYPQQGEQGAPEQRGRPIPTTRVKP